MNAQHPIHDLNAESLRLAARYKEWSQRLREGHNVRSMVYISRSQALNSLVELAKARCSVGCAAFRNPILELLDIAEGATFDDKCLYILNNLARYGVQLPAHDLMPEPGGPRCVA